MNLSVAYDLWDSVFSDGDKIVLITDDDRIYFDKIVGYDDHGITLESHGFIWWYSIRFASHDGFPVRKVMDTASWRFIAKLRSKTNEAKIREILRKEFSGPEPMPRMRARFGDPFELTRAVEMSLAFDEVAREPALLIESQGLQGLLYDLASIIDLEAA